MTVQGTAAQPLDGQGGVDIHIPVKAVNESDDTITWMYDRVKHQLLPGVPTFIPYLAMCLYQGDPRAVNRVGRPRTEQYRSNELERLRIFCGTYEHAQLEDCIHARVTCYPIDSDIPFNTVLRDPDGTAGVDVPATSDQSEFLRTEMSRMAEQMRIMQAQLQVQSAQQQAINSADVDLEDLPTSVTTAKTVAPEGMEGKPARPTSKVSKATAEPKVTKDQ